MQVIFISNDPLSAAEAETQLGDLIRNVVVLRQNENR
jgi:hypothetical protein